MMVNILLKLLLDWKSFHLLLSARVSYNLSALGLQILFLGLLKLPTSFVSTVELSLSQDV